MSKETKNSSEEEPTSSEENPEGITTPKKNNWVGMITRVFLRTLIYSVVVIFLAIAAVGIVLEYYFPAEEARLLVEGQVTKQLKLPLKIQKIGFSLLSGLQLDNVSLGFATMPVAKVKKIVLDYDLTQLLQGKLVINQVMVDQPQLTAVSKNGVWNFQPLLDLAKPSPAPADKDKSELPFALPEVDLKELNLSNASARLDQDGKLIAHVSGLNVEAQGKVNLNALDLKLKVLLNPGKDSNIGFQSKGTMNFQSRVFSNLEFSASDLNHLLVSGELGLENNQLSMDSLTLPSPNVGVIVDAKVSMKPEFLNLNNLQMSLGKNNLLKVSGDVINFSKNPAFNLMINEASFRLEDLLDWGKQWAPPLSGKGLLNAKAVKVSGSLPGFALKDLIVKGGMLSTKNLQLNYPDQKAQIEDLNTDLELKDIVIKNSQLEKASLNLNMLLKKGTVQEAEIKGLKQSLDITAKGKDLADVILEFSSDIKSLHYNHPETKEVFLPVHVAGALKGNTKKGDLNHLKLTYRLGTLVNGAVTGSVKKFGQSSVQVDQNLSMNLTNLANQLPKKVAADLIKGLKGSVQAQTSITGKLDDKFSPVRLNGQANFQLKGLTTQLKEPSINIDNLNTQVSFPLEFDTAKGARISHLNIHADIKSAKARGIAQINAFELETKLMMKGFHNLKPEFGTFPVQMDARLALGSIRNQEPALSLANLKSDINLKTDLQADDVRNTRAEGNLSFENLSALGMVKVNEWLSQFKLDVHDKSLSRVRISQKTKIKQPSFHQDDLALELKSVRLETLSRQNLEDGEVNIDTFVLQTSDLFNARMKATLKNWGESFDVDGKVESLQLASLWDHIPGSIKSDLGTLKTDGTLDISLKAKGTLPSTKLEEDETTSAIPPKPLLAQLLVPDKVGGKTPVEFETQILLKNGLLNDSEKKILAENLSTKTRLTFKNGQGELKGDFSGKVDGLTNFSLTPEFEYHYALDNLNILKIKQHQFKLKNQGLKHSLEGYLKGLEPFITGQRPISPNEILNRLDIKLANTNTIDISQAITADTEELLGDLKAKGIIESRIKFYQSAGKNLSLDGSLGFDKLSLRLPSEIALENLTGTFPFTKSIQINPKREKEKTNEFSPAQKKFFTPLRNFSRYKNNIRADSLEVKGQAIKDIGLDIVFKDNRLMAEKFIFDILGGSVGGNLFLIQDQQGPVIKFSTEFAGIDSSKLFAIPLEKKADSKVDGNLQIKLKINTGIADQPVSLDQLNVKIAITRIGAQTLDRLLLFIDPEESKPAIMDTRSKLKLASPHRVMISLENGNLNVEAWLKSDLLGIIKAPELKRVPVAALKRFSTIHEHLQILKDLEQVSSYLSARGIQFKDEKMILHY
jgi:hypothetical protein